MHTHTYQKRTNINAWRLNNWEVYELAYSYIELLLNKYKWEQNYKKAINK